MFKNSRPEVFCRKVVLKNFVKLTGEYLCWSLSLINCKTQIFEFNIKRLQHSSFLANFENFLRVPIL